MDEIQMKPLISLVYNSDDFLLRSIEAFQNLLYSKMKLILVDDGSTDSSLSICKQFAKKDSRIKVFHKNNEGAASARNYGIEHSSGKYIAFCDSDDYYGPTAFDIMKNLAEENNADIVCCDARVKNIRNTRCFHKGPELAVCDNVEWMALFLRNQGTSSNVWGDFINERCLIQFVFLKVAFTRMLLYHICFLPQFSALYSLISLCITVDAQILFKHGKMNRHGKMS